MKSPPAIEEAFRTVESFSLTSFAKIRHLSGEFDSFFFNDKGSPEMKLTTKSDSDLGSPNIAKSIAAGKGFLKIAGSVRPLRRRTDRVGGSFAAR